MPKLKLNLISLVGLVGVAIWLILFIKSPGFPSADKLFIFLVFVGLVLNQYVSGLVKFSPLALILLIYVSFKGLVPTLEKHVHYTLMPNFDKFLFGTLPTVTLQHWLWHGHVVWYDYIFYVTYMIHFSFPIILGIVIYKTRNKDYWRYAMTYVVAALAGFAVYVLYPAAPPWLASQQGYIPHITRIAHPVVNSFGVHNFSQVYSRFTPNPIASVPSLHATFSVLFSLFVFKLFGKKWGTLSLIYPSTIIFGVIYMGDHYFFDVLTGVLLAIASFALTPYILKHGRPQLERLKEALKKRRVHPAPKPI